MQRVSVQLQLVTPLFLAGADPRGQPELRAPSLRGLLRFWLRALLGGVLNGQPHMVFQKECRVFGSTDSASPVVVRLTGSTGSFVKYSKLVGNSPKLTYLFFGARSTQLHKVGREGLR